MPIESEGVEVILQKKQPPPTTPPTPTPTSMYMNPEPSHISSTPAKPPTPTSTQMFMNPQPKPAPISGYVEKGNVATLIKNLEGFATEGQQQVYDAQAVQRAANAVPSPTLIKNIEAFAVEGQQNLLDLQAQEFAKSDYGKLLEANLGAKRMYESAIAAGRPPPTFTLIKPTIITQQAQMQEQKPTLQEAYQQYHDVRMPELLKAESETFYKGIGYPQYAGKYGTFNIPAGYRVLNISEQGGNLAVTFAALPTQATQTPKGSVGLALKAVPFLTGIGQSIAKPFLEIGDIAKYNIAHPVQALGPKLPFYPIGLEEQRIFKEKTDVSVFVLSTAALVVAPPLIPLKLAGSVALGLGARTLIASGIGAGVGYYYNPTIQGAAVGALLGGAMYLGAFAVTRGVTHTVQKSLQGSYESSVQAGELWKPSTLQKLGMAVTGAKPKPLATSIVGLPTVQEGSLISAPYEETFIEGGQLATRTVIPSATQKWAGGLDVFDLTNAPRTSGYGLTQPPPIAPQIPEGGLPLISLSNALRPTPQGKLSFTKEPQTYRVEEESPLSFSKEYGELPTQTGLLQEIAKQEAKLYSGAGSMENVFGPAITAQESAMMPVAAVTLGDMTSWLQKQETQTKTVQTSAITPISFTPQLQTQTRQIDETQFLTVPGQALTVNVPTRETRETVVSPILDLGTEITGLGKQREGTVQGLPLLEKQVIQITQPQKSLVSNVLISPLLESAVGKKQTERPIGLLSGLTESNIGLNLFPNITPKEIVTPFTTPIVTPKSSLVNPIPTKGTFVPPITPIVTPKLFTLPKSGMGGLGPRESASLLYPFGRQKRKYPVMTGGQVAKFLFSGKTQTKRKRKK